MSSGCLELELSAPLLGVHVAFTKLCRRNTHAFELNLRAIDLEGMAYHHNVSKANFSVISNASIIYLLFIGDQAPACMFKPCFCKPCVWTLLTLNIDAPFLLALFHTKQSQPANPAENSIFPIRTLLQSNPTRMNATAVSGALVQVSFRQNESLHLRQRIEKLNDTRPDALLGDICIGYADGGITSFPTSNAISKVL